ncbi:MAG: NAD-dependent deacetylase, partial [Thauera aminoaromatica]
ARPNILMFGDWAWIPRRTEAQEARLVAWLEHVRRPVVVELGAGENVPTVRRFAESIGGRLVRINPQAEPMLPAGAIHLRCGALEGIATVHAALVGHR